MGSAEHKSEQQRDNSSSGSTRSQSRVRKAPQRRLGNRFLAHLLGGPRLPIQARLHIENSDTPCEQEADDIATRVMSSTGSPVESTVSEERAPRIQAKRTSAADIGSVAAPRTIHDALQTSGQPLDGSARQFMETRFGHDFNDVRVHTDAQTRTPHKVSTLRLTRLATEFSSAKEVTTLQVFTDESFSHMNWPTSCSNVHQARLI